MRTVLLNIMKACSSHAGQQPPGHSLAAQPPLLRPLHTLITACLEVPTAALTPNPVDVALYEALANALAPVNSSSSSSPTEDEGQRAGNGNVFARPSAVSSQDGDAVQRQLLHFVLSTYVRRYLCRQALRVCAAKHCPDTAQSCSIPV